MGNRVLISGVFYFLLLSSLMAQINSRVPDLFDQYFNNYHLLNPANTDSSYKFKLAAGNKSETGLFEGVNKLYIDGDGKLNDKKTSGTHFIGLQATSNHEGEYISRNRLYGRYSYRTRLTDLASVSAGISLGFINYTFKSSQASTGGSDFVPDGNAGIWYLRRTFSAGISIQQIFREKLRPVNQEYQTNSFYNINLVKSFILNSYLKLNTHYYSMITNKEATRYALSVLAEYNELVEAGLSFRYKRGLNFIGGIKNLNIGENRISLYFSYLSRSGRTTVNDNAIELFVCFKR